MPSTAGSSHNPEPVVKLEPPSIDSDSSAELEYSVGNVSVDMEAIPEEPQQQVAVAADQSVPDGQTKWRALVDVCSMLFEKLVEAEKAELERNALINGGELPVAQNVTVGNQPDQPKVKEENESYDDDDDDFSDEDDDDDDDDDDGDNLVIDEGPEAPPPKKQSVVALHNSQRASVIIAVPRHAAPSSTTGSSSVQSDSEQQPSTSSDSGCSRSRSVDGGGSGSSVEVRYNKNMARSFPGTEDRTPEQQALRTRNTLAARQSRAKLRMLDEILSHEAENESLLNEFVKERVAACFTYGNYLRELQDLEPMDFWSEFEAIKDQYVVEPLRAQHHVPRGTGPPLRRLRSDFEHDDDENMEQSEEREDAPRRSPMPWEDFIERVFPMFRFGRRGDLRGDLSGDLGGEF